MPNNTCFSRAGIRGYHSRKDIYPLPYYLTLVISIRTTYYLLLQTKSLYLLGPATHLLFYHLHN